MGPVYLRSPTDARIPSLGIFVPKAEVGNSIVCSASDHESNKIETPLQRTH